MMMAHEHHDASQLAAMNNPRVYVRDTGCHLSVMVGAREAGSDQNN